MNEHFLAFVWRRRLFQLPCLTTDGQDLDIIHPCFLNHDGGPDFKEAKIRINGTLWHGHVELHVKSSDWYRHKHESDPAYDNVILHVVHEADEEVKNAPGRTLDCLELRSLIPDKLIHQWQSMSEALHWLPCHAHIKKVNELTLTKTKEGMAVERLMVKVNEWKKRLDDLTGDWNQLCFEKLCYAFGLKVNGNIFEQMAIQTPWKILSRESFVLKRVEALLFGQCALLDNGSDPYFVSLKREYDFLQSKFDLQPIRSGSVQFLRTRPHNFPTIRIAQLAALIHSDPTVIQKLLTTFDLSSIRHLFKIEVNPYWKGHYMFGKPTKSASRSITKDMLDRIIINAIVPLQFLYADMHDDDQMKQMALGLLESIDPEKNKIVSAWKKEGMTCANALESQGLLFLERQYCRGKKCFQCGIGSVLLGQT